MNYTELSIEKLREVSIEAAKDIKKEKSPDLIIYVARAGLPIAVFMDEVFDARILGMSAHRKGNKLKSVLGPIISKFPRFVRNVMITFELKSKVHKKNIERFVEFHKSIENIDTNKKWEILIVDDSVDTGHSMHLVYEKVREVFNRSNIYTYSLNVWEQSKTVFKTDYFSYSETVIRAPMSKDSSEYTAFCEMYDKETQNGYV